MKHNSSFLLALDVDGTLARPDGTISPRTVEVVKRLQRDGMILCIASGRPPLGICPVAELLGMDEFGGYIIGYNGGVLIDYSTNKMLYKVLTSEKVLTCETVSTRNERQQHKIFLMTRKLRL